MNDADLTVLCDLAAAAATVRPLLSQLAVADLARPTPCSGWTVQDLTGHLVANPLAFAGWAAPGPATAPAPAGSQPAQICGEELAESYDAAIAEVARSYRAAMDRQSMVTTPFGPLPATPVLAVCVADQLTHAWDLGTAMGADVRPDPALTDRALAAWRGFISDELRADGTFAPAAAAGPQASPLDRVAAFTGRTAA